jgi:protein N-terminal methyltransferase
MYCIVLYCIVLQWVIGHLTDEDFVAFLNRCTRALRPGGLIVVKENISRKGFVFDTEDSSVTRFASSSRQSVIVQCID